MHSFPTLPSSFKNRLLKRRFFLAKISKILYYYANAVNERRSTMTKKETLKRYLLFVISLFFIALGVAFTKHAELGVSPISAVANVISCKFTQISFGTWLFISNCVMIIGQILLLRRDFQPIQLLQIPLSFIFGYFTDFGMWFAGMFSNETYVLKLVLVAVGIVVLGFGIALSVIASVILNSGEAFVKALADVSKKDFANVKIAFDVSWVTLAIVLSLLLFNGELEGVREGTIISAVCVGLVVKLFKPLLHKPLTKMLEK